MTLGSVRSMRVGDYYTQPPVDFLNPPRTTPSFPQNLARQTLNGLGRLGGFAFGDVPVNIPTGMPVGIPQGIPTSIPSGIYSGPAQQFPAQPGTTTVAAPNTMAVAAPAAPTHPALSPATRAVWGTLATASFVASTYHGYKRNNSLGWALWWGLMGSVFPIVTPTIAVAQGFAVRKGHRR
jgi:hypothetical protein